MRPELLRNILAKEKQVIEDFQRALGLLLRLVVADDEGDAVKHRRAIDEARAYLREDK